MEVSYQRDLNHNYMVIPNACVSGDEYTVRMLEQNRIAGLLSLRTRKMDGKTFLYYEIASKQPLTHLYETHTMGKKEIEGLLYGIREILERMRQYLLDGAELLFCPEYVFMDLDTGSVWLCYMPGSAEMEESGQSGFRELSEFLLKRLDHGDRGAVDLGYELFERVSRDNFSLQDVLRAVSSQRDRTGKTDEKIIGEGIHAKCPRVGSRESDSPRVGSRESNGLKADSWESDSLRTGIPGSDDREQDSMRTGKWEGERWEQDGRLNGRQAPQGMQGRKKEKSQGKRQTGAQNQKKGKKRLRNIILCAAAVILIMLAFGAVVYFAGLDLTQTGGLAFLCLAVVWGVYSAVSSRKERKRKIWPDDEEEDEDEFLEALMNQVYSQEKKPEEISDVPGWSTGGKEREKPRVSPREQEPGGETRCLAETEMRKQIRLVSQEPEKYPDLELSMETALLGKKKDQVDIWIGRDAVSRIHARLDRTGEGGFVTDLNSMNGTFLNGERLKPNEKRPLCHGDRISFANLHYRVKIRDF